MKTEKAFPAARADLNPGMDLRDYFASLWIVNRHAAYYTLDPKQIAKNAYAYADAMMDARKQNQGKS